MKTLDDPNHRPMAAACPDLPRITPELLWFQSYGHEAPQRCVMLGDADVVFAFAGVIYAMRTEEWLRFEGMVNAALEGFA